MKVLIFADCMAIDDQVEEEFRYPALLKSRFPKATFDVVTLDGCTTFESLERFQELKQYDVVLYGFGINNALPRGLTRPMRGKIIRAMYSLKLGKNMRLHARTYFLNPLEYILQVFGKRHHYFTVDQTLEHFNQVIDAFSRAKLYMILINPIKNYRFLHANRYIAIYNQAIKNLCINRNIAYFDTELYFNQIGIHQALAKDLFHYSKHGHKVLFSHMEKQLSPVLDI